MPADQTGTPSATTTADRLGWLTTFAAGCADPDGTAPWSTLDDYSAPADGVGTVRTAGDQLVGAIKNGAADRPLQLGGNAMPGGLALEMVPWEYVVPGWDLAVATGQDWDPPAEAAAQALAFAPGMLTEDYRGPGKSLWTARPGPRRRSPSAAAARAVRTGPALDRVSRPRRSGQGRVRTVRGCPCGKPVAAGAASSAA